MIVTVLLRGFATGFCYGLVRVATGRLRRYGTLCGLWILNRGLFYIYGVVGFGGGGGDGVGD